MTSAPASPIIACPVCLGQRRLPNRKVCFACGGTGRVFRPEPGDEMVVEPPTETDTVVYVLTAACENGCAWDAPDSTKPHRVESFNGPVRCTKCRWGLMSFTFSDLPVFP